MRPTRLELEGFASFRDRAELEFGDAELFVFAGPTGSGKTSLLDAIGFSLYGSVPRYPSRNWVAPVVSQGLNQARVRFTFDLEGTRYAATRVVRRTDSGASTREARLERLVDGEVAETLAGSAAELTGTVEQLLGLSFEHFVKTVVLPQGAFQDFLHARPSERQDLLVELLGLDVYRRIASAARARATEAEQAATLAERRLDGELSSATEEALEEAQARVGALEELSERISEARPRLRELREEGGRLAEAAERARERAERLGDVEAPGDVEELSARRGEAAGDVEDAAAALQEAVRAREEAEEAQAELPEPGLLSDVRRLVERRRDLEQRRERARGELEEARDAAEEADEHLAGAREAAGQARTALREARRSDLAATLSEGLEAGDDCPVCERTLERAPDHGHDDLTAAEDAVAEAEEALEQARTAASDADADLAASRREHDGVTEQLGDVEDDLEEAADRLASALTGDGDGDGGGDRDPPGRDLTDETVLDELEQELETAAERLRRARTAERDARADHERAEEALAGIDDEHDRAWRVFDDTRDALGGLEPPPVDRDDLAGSWSALVAWADRRRPELEKEAGEAEAAVSETRAAYRDLQRELVDACERLDVTVGEDRSPGEAVAAALERARTEASSLADRLAEAEEVRGQLEEHRERARVAEDLGRHLSAPRFERWLLNRALRRLVVGATEIMQQLSNGAYSLALDDSNQFQVVDHRNADESRSARTLSGGETFLASLSLALALSEHVAELAAGSSPRLEALFLDEGFGALDADTLDTVAAAIEELGSSGRMVGLITHVRDLAERIPVRFEVRKTAGGSSVEKVVT